MYVDDGTFVYSVWWAQNLVCYLAKSPYIRTVVVRLATHYLWSKESGARRLHCLDDLLLFVQGHGEVELTERDDSQNLHPLREADFD